MNIAEKLVPDFTIADGRLDMERQFEFAEGDTYIFVDTKNEEMAEEKILENLREYSSVMILDSRNAIIKSKGQVQTLYFSDLGDLDMSKSDLIEMVRPFVTMAIVLILVLSFVFMEVFFFFGVLFVGLFGMIVASCMKANLTFGELYKLGIYTRTTSLLLKAVFSFLPIGIPLYPIVSLGISLGYLAGAIRTARIWGAVRWYFILREWDRMIGGPGRRIKTSGINRKILAGMGDCERLSSEGFI